jgi:hypothetical protein
MCHRCAGDSVWRGAGAACRTGMVIRDTLVNHGHGRGAAPLGPRAARCGRRIVRARALGRRGRCRGAPGWWRRARCSGRRGRSVACGIYDRSLDVGWIEVFGLARSNPGIADSCGFCGFAQNHSTWMTSVVHLSCLGQARDAGRSDSIFGMRASQSWHRSTIHAPSKQFALDGSFPFWMICDNPRNQHPSAILLLLQIRHIRMS